ncbi:MAG: hypothetical protein VCC00_14790 [Deltaproteobacteria bacterium]
MQSAGSYGLPHRFRARLLTGGLLTMAACTGAPAEAAFLEVTRSEAGFTVDAEDLPVVRILRAIGEQAGFEVHDPTGGGEELEFFEVEDLPLETTLRQLLARTNHLIVYRGGAKEKMAVGTIEKIILLRPNDPDAPRVLRKGVSPLAGPVAPPVRTAPNVPEAPDQDAGIAALDDYAQADLDQALAIELALEAAIDAPEGSGLPPDISAALEEIDPSLVADVEAALRATQENPPGRNGFDRLP